MSIEDVSWGNGSPYVRISVGETDMTLPLTGWSLENARGERVEIGLGVEEFSLGKIPLPTTIQVASNTALFASFHCLFYSILFKILPFLIFKQWH